MKSIRFLILPALATFALFVSLFQSPIAAQGNPIQAVNPAGAPQIVIRGHAFCLDESGRRLDTGQNCSKGTHLFEFVASDKKLYKFASDDVLTAMFKESRVRKMDLQISGLLRPPNTLEITSLQAIHDGKLYDIFYYCDICSITAFGPGDCPCCYNPLEFREKPALENQ